MLTYRKGILQDGGKDTGRDEKSFVSVLRSYESLANSLTTSSVA